MATYHAGEIVLLSFPYADASAGKRRPGLVLLDTGDEDLVIARLTTQITRGPFDVELTDWQQAGLALPSVVRLHKVATLEKHLVKRSLGSLSTDDWTRVRAVIQQLWAPLLEGD